MKKVNKFNLRRVFIIVWIASIFSFIFTIDTSNSGKFFPISLTLLFLGNILIGIISFFLAIFSNKLFKNFDNVKFISLLPLIAFAYFIFYITALTINGYGLIAGMQTNGDAIMPTSSKPNPTSTPGPTYSQDPPLSKVQQRSTGVVLPVNSQGVTVGEGELINAVNFYRQAHGLSSLNRNESLCQETRKRVQDMVSLNSGREVGRLILNHDGMAADVQSGTLNKLTGMTYFGENIASAACKRPSDGQVVHITTGTQLVEWCFDASTSHRENLLNPTWSEVCSSGQFPFYVQTFAK